MKEINDRMLALGYHHGQVEINDLCWHYMTTKDQCLNQAGNTSKKKASRQ
jgi:hypothetical protein